jgi:DNA/RNA endonuclease G (NUC1)
LDKQTRRLWLSWEDYMREWCRRADFRQVLPVLLQGEDEDFRGHILRICAEETPPEVGPPPREKA